MQLLLDRLWYGTPSWGLLLAPLSWAYCLAAVLRAWAYRAGLLPRRRFPVPVVVVGNIAAGGTGKTPLVLWIARFLSREGFSPAIVCRGYGGRARTWPQQVRADSDPTVVGDEAVLLARHTGCPVAAGPDRVRSIEDLVAHNDCDVVISDDGLQHYAMDRDVEIAVIDGARRHGNGLCLPGGPLREPRSRLRRVDMVVTNGVPRRGEIGMTLEARILRRVRDPEETRAPEALRDAPVHAVAGIGHPARFFEQLRNLGFRITAHPFPDHHSFAAGDIAFDDDLQVVMTEKDAVKCRAFATDRHWYLPVEARPQEALGFRLSRLLADARPPEEARRAV